MADKRAYLKQYHLQRRAKMTPDELAQERERQRVRAKRYAANHRETIRLKRQSSANRASYREYARKRRAANPAQARAKDRAKYQANRERILQSAHKYSQTHTEQRRAYNTQYRARTREQAKSYRHAYYEAHKALYKALHKAWHARHEGMQAFYTRQRQARIANAPIRDLTRAQWLAIQEAQDHRCAYCDKRCKGTLTQDHILPLSKGGSHTLHNVIGACGSCNSKKFTGPPLRAVQPLLIC